MKDIICGSFFKGSIVVTLFTALAIFWAPVMASQCSGYKRCQYNGAFISKSRVVDHCKGKKSESACVGHFAKKGECKNTHKSKWSGGHRGLLVECIWTNKKCIQKDFRRCYRRAL